MSYDAILLLSFGGPEKREEVMPFLENVLRGRNVPRERMLEVAEHYYRFGGRSPINDYCRQLLAAMRASLPLPVYWGNRNWHPLLAETMRQMARDGVRRALALATSAYAGYSGCRQYLENIETARREVGEDAPVVDKIPPFCAHPLFVQANAERVREAMERIAEAGRPAARVVYTAHSIPVAMAAASEYEGQIRATARAVSARLGIAAWDVAWQSRSGPPAQPWLEPDILTHLRALAVQGVEDVLIAPIGFLSDHMEVLYDLDVEAADLCSGLGLRMTRAGTAGLHPTLLRMIGELVREGMAAPEPPACADVCCPPPLRPQAARPAGSGALSRA
ncbi:MAG: ferrochelatase [Bryobacteraceae bacterium]|jgi:ferrochelatase